MQREGKDPSMAVLHIYCVLIFLSWTVLLKISVTGVIIICWLCFFVCIIIITKEF